MKQPVRVTVTGAAGQIGYAHPVPCCLRRHAGDDQPVIPAPLDITRPWKRWKASEWELEDCAFPLLAGIVY